LANQEYGEKQKNSNYIIQFPDAPIEAYNAFAKAEEINKAVEAYEMLGPLEGRSKLYALLLIRGVDQIIANDLDNAKNTLEKSVVSYEMVPPSTPLKGEPYYYYAHVLDKLAQMYSDAIQHDSVNLNIDIHFETTTPSTTSLKGKIRIEIINLQKSAFSYYEKALKDGSVNPNVYIRMIDFYKNENNKSKVLELINLGKKNIPDDPNILLAEVDYYYWIENFEKAHQLIAKLPASVYSNPDAIVNVANFYINDNNYGTADSLLKKAYQLNPHNFVVVYNLGYCNLKLYEINFLESNDLAIKGFKDKSTIANILADNYLTEAEKYFEFALDIEPKDIKILEQLKEIYARKQSPKYDAIIERINSINK
jgi:tetratricopeptide (TPR) repeat protein